MQAMADLDATLGVASPAEQNLVEKSQDSVRVTKQRLHRASMTQDKEEEAEDSGEHTVDPRQDSIAHARRQANSLLPGCGLGDTDETREGGGLSVTENRQ